MEDQVQADAGGRSIIERLGGGAGVAAIITALTGAAALVIASWPDRGEDAEGPATAATDTRAGGPAAMPNSAADPASPPGEPSAPSVTEPAASGRGDRPDEAQPAASEPPPGRSPGADTGPPPNAVYPHRAVVRFQGRAPNIFMMAEPSATSARVARLGPGDIFFVGETVGDYYRASTAEGLTGFIPVDLVTLVRETTR